MMLKHKRRKTLNSFSLAILCCSFISITSSLSSAQFDLENDNEYVVHYLSLSERGRIVVTKCCPLSQALTDDGKCVDINLETISNKTTLESRIRRAVDSGSNVNDDENQDSKLAFFTIGLIQDSPSCRNGILHLRKIKLESNGTFFTSSMEFMVKEDVGYLLIDPTSYCVDWASADEFILVQFCLEHSCHSSFQQGSHSPKNETFPKLDDGSVSLPMITSKSLCLRKCCPPLQVIDMTSFTCVKQDIPWQLYPLSWNMLPDAKHGSSERSSWEFQTNISSQMSNEHESRIPLPVTWLTGTPNCVQSYEVYADEYDRYYINSEGVLITEQNGTVAKTPPGEYCFEAVLQHNGYNKQPVFSRLDVDAFEGLQQIGVRDGPMFSRQMAMVCFDDEDGDYSARKKNSARGTPEEFSWRVLYPILTGISCVFLLITCVIYTILWKELNLPGWLQFAYALALLLTFALLSVAQLWTQRIHDISKSLCRVLGYGLHFSFLSCFFWLTSMNLDLFLSFRSTSTALIRGFGKTRGKRRFLEFTAFSIGFPATITLLLLAVDSCSSGKDDGTICSVLSTSGIGEASCVIDSRRKVAQLQYFYSFVGILLLLNLVIFVCTLISLRNRERETRIAKRQSTSAADYDRLQLFTRLFLIMGVLWIFEVISWLFEFFDVDDSIQKIFIFTDCLNASQGIAVFIMFVWKRQTWKQLKKKCKCCLSRKRTIVGANNINGTSMMSSHLSSTKSTDSNRLVSMSTVMTSIENDS